MIIDDARQSNGDKLYSHLNPEVGEMIMFPEFLAEFRPLVDNMQTYFANFILEHENGTFSVQPGLLSMTKLKNLYKALIEGHVFLSAFEDKHEAQKAVLEKAIDNLKILFEGKCARLELIRAAENLHVSFNAILDSEMHMLSNMDCTDISKTEYI